MIVTVNVESSSVVIQRVQSGNVNVCISCAAVTRRYSLWYCYVSHARGWLGLLGWEFKETETCGHAMIRKGIYSSEDQHFLSIFPNETTYFAIAVPSFF